jgi:hypothetical protein
MTGLQLVDQITLAMLLKILSGFGPYGLVLFIYWYDNRRIQQLIEQNRKDVADFKLMYENNVQLVKSYQDIATRILKIADDFSDVVMMNAQAMTRINDSVLTNQFCPQVRLVKIAGGKVEA